MPDRRERYAAAVRFHRAGRDDEAAALYREILEESPGHADALHMLGVIASSQGEARSAFDYFDAAAAAAPGNPGFLNNLGVSARRLGRTDDAVCAFQQALALDPGLVDARCNLGNALLDGGDAVAAIEQYRKALEIDPENTPALNNLANAYRSSGDLSQAIAIYGELATRNEDDPAAHNNLGVVIAERGDSDAALGHYRRALALDPAYSDALNNLGVALLVQGRGAEAETCFRDVLARDEASADTHGNLGNALRRQGKTAEAAAAYDAALSIRDDPGMRVRRATLLPVIAESADAMARARREMEAAVDLLLAEDIRIDDPMGSVGITQFHLSYHDTDNRVLNGKIAHLYSKACPSLNFVAPHCSARGPAPGARLKVGFVSRYFRNHAVGWCYQGIMRFMPRERISVSAFTFPHAGDELWDAIAADVDNAVILPESLAGARDRIAREELDVLVYTDIGMEPLTYYLAFSRLAPVQCATNGHPDTTGIPTIDYFIGSAPLEPPGEANPYSETLAALKGVLVHYERPEAPLPLRPRSAFGLPEDATLYLCPQSLFKFHPDMDAALVEILARDRDARLVIFDGPEPNWSVLLLDRWRKAMGDNIARVQILSRQTFKDFLNILSLADVILDTWPFGGGNTSYQGLAMATPIVTLSGRFARGRATTALYASMEMPDLVATSTEAYVALALRLGTEPAWRERMSSEIQRRSDVLFGDRGAVDEFARFLLSVGEAGRR